MWCKEDMLKLADEIKSFAEDVTQDYIDNYNLQLEKKRKLELERIEERNKQRAEEKKQREIPKSGLILLIRYPNSLYRFTYSTSLSLQAKIEIIKVQEGDNIQIIHSLETHDTLKFYHKFIKTQFSSRMEGRYYHLTDEDVQYFSDEKFPANAMELFQGTSNKRGNNVFIQINLCLIRSCSDAKKELSITWRCIIEALLNFRGAYTISLTKGAIVPTAPHFFVHFPHSSLAVWLYFRTVYQIKAMHPNEIPDGI